MHVYTEMNVTTVDELVGPLGQEDQKQTHCSTRQISKSMHLTQYSIIQIINPVFGPKFFFSFINTPAAYYR